MNRRNLLLQDGVDEPMASKRILLVKLRGDDDSLERLPAAA